MAKISIDQALLKAKSYAKKGEKEEATKLYQSVLQAFPKNIHAQQGLAALNKPKNDAPRAVPQEIIDRLVKLYNEGQLLAVVAQAQSLAEKYSEAFFVWNILGAANKGLGRTADAASAFKRVTELNPTYADGFNNLGVTLKGQGKLDEAIAAYNKALSIKPDYAEAYSNMGVTLKEQGKLDEAIAAYNKALSIKPDHADAYNNMGNALKDQGKPDEAIAAYNKALSIKPDYAEAYNNMGRLHWLQGNFKKAFELLEYRWLVKKLKIGEALKTSKPEWKGGKERLFVWKEQGIGDEVMFSSLLIDAGKQASSLIVECDHRLLPIYERSFPSNITFTDDRKKLNEKDFESHIAIGSLLNHFRSDRRDFAKSAAGWLKAEQDRTKNFRTSLLTQPKSKLIGLSWFTKSDKANSNLRSIEVEWLSDHLHSLPFEFVSLQYGLPKEELSEINSKVKIDIQSVEELNLFQDIDGLASLISACDIVISIDNINVHLAGALGVDTRVLLPEISDERWGAASELSYWYDSVTLYRQKKREDWSAPLLHLRKDLLDVFR